MFHRYMPVQMGSPIDGHILSCMDPEESLFWIDFLKEAETVISQKMEDDETQPWIPTNSLWEKYLTAVTRYCGRAYRQVHELEEMFVLRRSQAR